MSQRTTHGRSWSREEAVWRWYLQQLQTFPALFSAEFGYELEDPFVSICDSLGAMTPFAFSRFGDGEFNAILGGEGENCDGHQYFADLGRRLKNIVQAKPDYLMGLLPMAVMIHGVESIRALSGDIKWVSAGCFQDALTAGRFDRFLEVLDGRCVVLVGSPDLRGLAESRGWGYVSIHERNCWRQHDDVLCRLRRTIPGEDGVVLFCASMMSNVLIDDLHAVNPANSYIDVGSSLDPYAGVKTRVFHDVTIGGWEG